MATRIETPTRQCLHDQDVYAWSREQADLLRHGRWSELDLEHLIEEVEDVGASLYRTVRSRIRIIVEHLLKLEHSPSDEPRDGWKRDLRVQRLDLEDDLTPSLRPRVEANLERLYAGARLEAETALRAH